MKHRTGWTTKNSNTNSTLILNSKFCIKNFCFEKKSLLLALLTETKYFWRKTILFPIPLIIRPLSTHMYIHVYTYAGHISYVTYELYEWYDICELIYDMTYELFWICIFWNKFCDIDSVKSWMKLASQRKVSLFILDLEIHLETVSKKQWQELKMQSTVLLSHLEWQPSVTSFKAF